MPADAVLPPGAKAGTEVDGVYIVGAGSLVCCLVAPRATMIVRKVRRATSFCVNAYVPEAGPFLTRPQTLSISFEGFRERFVIPDLTKGFDDNRCVEIPAALRAKKGRVTVYLDSAIDYEPRRYHAGSDTQHYGLEIMSIYFE